MKDNDINKNNNDINNKDNVEINDESKSELVVQESTDIEEYEKDNQETKLLNTIDEPDEVLPAEVQEHSNIPQPNDSEVSEEGSTESETTIEETTYIEAPITEDELQMQEEEELKEEQQFKIEQTKTATSNIFGKLLGCLGNALFSIFILAMVFVIVMNAVSFVKGKEPSVFGYKMYVIGEDSMNPTIRKNDAIIVKETDASQLHVGDLITYTSKSGNEVITGWVTEIFDNNRLEVKKKMSSDQSVIIDGVAVIGLATYRIANMGEFIEFISHPIGIGAVLIVGVIIYIIMWLIGRRRSHNIN